MVVVISDSEENVSGVASSAIGNAAIGSWAAAKPRAQLIVLALGVIALVAVCIMSMCLVLRVQSDASWIERALRVQSKLSELESLVRGAEQAQRTHVMTGDDLQLRNYRAAVEAIAPALTELETATTDNASQREALAALKTLIRQNVDQLGETMRLYQAKEPAAALASMGIEQRLDLTLAIRKLVDRMTIEQTRLLAIRSQDQGLVNLWLVGVNLLCTVVILALAIASIVMVRHANSGRESALRSLAAANADLERTVAERTAHLQEANEEIRHTVAVLNNIINSMGDAVVVTDRAMSIVLMNSAARDFLGLSEDVSPKDWPRLYRIFLPDEVTPVAFEDGAVARASRGEAVDNLELFVRRHGEEVGIHLLVSGRPLRDQDGAVTGAVMVYRNITESRETERRLRHIHKMDAIGQLTGGVAHDFNNILTVVTGTIDILAGAVAHDPKLTAIARLIDDAAERGAELTGRLLAFARRQPLQPRPTDVNQLVVDSARLLQATLGEQVEVESMLEEKTWLAQVDPSQLTAALLNLAVNARDAMPGGGKLTLETGNVHLDQAYADTNIDVRPGPYVVVAVSDTGTGIPSELRDKVFEPFFTTKEPGKGTGLGLSMVYGFVKQSNGHIKIYSEEGHGTSIKLYLPRAEGHADQREDVSAAAHLKGGPESILVVEDDQLVRDYVVAQLGQLGYTTMTAENAAKALAIVDSGVGINLLFTDVVMPGGMNGRQLAEEVTRRRPSIKVLFTSGYTENAIVHHGRLDAGVLLLAKPYRKANLARMIRIALERSSSGPSSATQAAGRPS
jgi:PAS domain S-box-containing protein